MPTQDQDGSGSPPSHALFPIVGVGSSAGGLDALSKMLRALPVDTGMAFVLVQHLDPTHESKLPEILSQTTRMPVTEARDDVPLAPNHVYVMPPGADMMVAGGALRLSSRVARPGHFRPIDHFLTSLAQHNKHTAIAVLLSGGGTDGTLGMEAIKGEGGITFAQDSSAEHDGMPRSAVAAGCVDFVLPPNEIASEIARIALHPHIAAPGELREPQAHESDLERILQLVRKSGGGVDFTGYRRSTLYRRITRRMALLKLDVPRDYVRFLESDPHEVEKLYQDFLIGVTSFFRDPATFDLLKTKVFPKLVEQRQRNAPLRVWVLGCSTGEEAYSIAIAFSEFLEGAAKQIPLQIFATDVNAIGIERARTGVYPKTIAQDVSPEHLRRYFAEVDGKYRILKSIRDSVVFARHNALSDPPFSHVDLVSCRNLLIYLQPEAQQRLIPVLHYALNAAGFLWLGGSESVGKHNGLFDAVDARHKIYVRKPGRAHVAVRAQAGRAGSKGSEAGFRPAEHVAGVESHREGDRLLLARYAPPGVMINDDLEIVQFRGDASAYLAPAPGKAS
ncbi:MAG: chemotaxis protein CheB, partial [Gemmatimonadaceae bacterium]